MNCLRFPWPRDVEDFDDLSATEKHDYFAQKEYDAREDRAGRAPTPHPVDAT